MGGILFAEMQYAEHEIESNCRRVRIAETQYAENNERVEFPKGPNYRKAMKIQSLNSFVHWTVLTFDIQGSLDYNIFILIQIYSIKNSLHEGSEIWNRAVR